MTSFRREAIAPAADASPAGGFFQKPAGKILLDLGLLALSSLLFALSFPSFLSDWGWFPLAFISLVPLFVVVHRARWPAIPFYGIFFGYLSYALFNFIHSPSSWFRRSTPPISCS
jgi:apolipoprotein N-acyltransferase